MECLIITVSILMFILH